MKKTFWKILNCIKKSRVLSIDKISFFCMSLWFMYLIIQTVELLDLTSSEVYFDEREKKTNSFGMEKKTFDDTIKRECEKKELSRETNVIKSSKCLNVWSKINFSFIVFYSGYSFHLLDKLTLQFSCKCWVNWYNRTLHVVWVPLISMINYRQHVDCSFCIRFVCVCSVFFLLLLHEMVTNSVKCGPDLSKRRHHNAWTSQNRKSIYEIISFYVRTVAHLFD